MSTHLHHQTGLYARAALLLMAIFVCASPPAMALNLIIELSRQDLQQKIDRMFPREMVNEFFVLRLENPRVNLTEGRDRIGLQLDAAISIPDELILMGSAEVSGSPRLLAERGEIYLDDASLEQLHVEGVPELLLPQLQTAAAQLLRSVLNNQPLYVLGQQADPPLLKSKDLKAIRVQDGKLLIELAMP